LFVTIATKDNGSQDNMETPDILFSLVCGNSTGETFTIGREARKLTHVTGNGKERHNAGKKWKTLLGIRNSELFSKSSFLYYL